jgi:hypothetical protein
MGEWDRFLIQPAHALNLMKSLPRAPAPPPLSLSLSVP